jgi:PDZ domain
MKIPRITLVTLIVLLGVLVTPMYAFGGPKPSVIEARGIAAMQAGDYQEAETVFRQLIKLRSDSFVGYYNLGAALSMQGDVGGAVDAISQAITIGFSDLNQIKRDPDLESFRSSEFYGDLVDNWQALIEARRQNDLENMKLLITRRPESRTDEAHKIELLSAHDAIATDEAIEELAMIATWAQGNIFPESASPEALEDLPWIMVVLPDRAGFAKWAIKVFGPSVRNSMSSVGGAYEHQNRRLVAQDLGATIRHEFIHVLHWRDMNRLGQVHAPWIQEGLASLVEDYDMVGAKPVPVASWRTNIVKRMSERHRMPSIEKLASTEMNAFTAKRPLAKYAQARAVMLYLYDQGLLGKFYATYTEQYHEDPTGISALETVLAQDLNAIEKDYRNWIERLEAVPETGKDLSATMGIGIENGTGDGVVVKELPGNARSRTGLHVGSVITAINGHPTRDLFELIRILGKYGPGQTITLSVRRGKLHSTTTVALLAR